MGCVYIATNIINNKIYIGKTVKSLRYRIKSHISDAYKFRRNSLFFNAIRKYGPENFEWRILYETANNYELSSKEIEFIKQFKSNDNSIGYNLTEGGEGTLGRKYSKETIEKKKTSYNGNLLFYVKGEANHNSKLKENDVREIKKLLYFSSKPFCDIAKQFNIGAFVIYEISKNNIWKDIDCEVYINKIIPARDRKLRGSPLESSKLKRLETIRNNRKLKNKFYSRILNIEQLKSLINLIKTKCYSNRCLAYHYGVGRNTVNKFKLLLNNKEIT